jgi:hypothetical protein
VRESRGREIGLCVRGHEMPAMRRGEWGEREERVKEKDSVFEKR